MLFILALLASGCSSEDALAAGDAATVGTGSTVEFAVDGGKWVKRTDGETVPSGAQVRAAAGQARLVFRSGAARFSSSALATVTADTVTLQRGQLLVSSRGSLRAALPDDTTVAGTGLYRLVGGLASRVGVYSGEVSVRRPAQRRVVAARRQLDLTAFRLGSVDPLQYRTSDVWDRELLADAIAFDGEAARLASGLDNQLGDGPRRSAFYGRFVKRSDLVPVLTAMAGVTRRNTYGPPSDLLLPLFVAQAAPGPVDTAMRAVSDLRAAGARWGLISAELDVSSRRMVAAIDAVAEQRLAVRETPRRDGAAGPARERDEVQTASAGAAPTTAQSGVARAPASSGTDGANDSDTSTGTPPPADGGNDDPPVSAGRTDPKPRDEPTAPDDPDEPDDPQDPVTSVVDGVVKEIEARGGNLPDTPDLPGLPGDE